MVERSYFFNTPEGGPAYEYKAGDFARFHAQIIGNGVSNTNTLDDLAVSSKQNMTVSLAAGYAFANGYMYENTAAKDLIHDIAEPDTDRIDRIVIAFDNTPTQRKTYSYVKKGIPGTNPTPPSLTRSSYIYELSVAQVLIEAGKSYIENYQITDERTIDSVCGYIPLHNIYRALSIDEHGTASFLNQSFIKSINEQGVTFEQSQVREVPWGTIIEDTQGEINSDSTFIARARGIYSFWAEIGWWGISFPVGIDVQIYVYVNGEEAFPMVAKVLDSSNDNFVIASGIDRLQAGDEVQFKAIVFHTGGDPVTPNLIRLRVAKLS
ncbi:hypothetical protein [Sediminibacillus terrae]|uniref:hypothetical protein n=1 Tax=Sediminibacillus terrae TaxID=1562106 RepID=UPI0012958B96|nr:hypothetical protein [Sediminibacillus terrae]